MMTDMGEQLKHGLLRAGKIASIDNALAEIRRRLVQAVNEGRPYEIATIGGSDSPTLPDPAYVATITIHPHF